MEIDEREQVDGNQEVATKLSLFCSSKQPSQQNTLPSTTTVYLSCAYVALVVFEMVPGTGTRSTSYCGRRAKDIPQSTCTIVTMCVIHDDANRTTPQSLAVAERSQRDDRP